MEKIYKILRGTVGTFFFPSLFSGMVGARFQAGRRQIAKPGASIMGIGNIFHGDHQAKLLILHITSDNAQYVNSRPFPLLSITSPQYGIAGHYFATSVSDLPHLYV